MVSPQIRAERDTAHTVIDDLRQALLSIQAERDEASAELAALQTASATASARIIELEEQGATRDRIRDLHQHDALTDFATLCDTLRSNVAQLEQT